MSGRGGFGRGRFIDQDGNSLHFSTPRFTEANDGFGDNAGTTKSSFMNRQSNFSGGGSGSFGNQRRDRDRGGSEFGERSFFSSANENGGGFSSGGGGGSGRREDGGSFGRGFGNGFGGDGYGRDNGDNFNTRGGNYGNRRDGSTFSRGRGGRDDGGNRGDKNDDTGFSFSRDLYSGFSSGFSGGRGGRGGNSGGFSSGFDGGRNDDSNGFSSSATGSFGGTGRGTFGHGGSSGRDGRFGTRRGFSDSGGAGNGFGDNDSDGFGNRGGNGFGGGRGGEGGSGGGGGGRGSSFGGRGGSFGGRGGSFGGRGGSFGGGRSGFDNDGNERGRFESGFSSGRDGRGGRGGGSFGRSANSFGRDNNGFGDDDDRRTDNRGGSFGRRSGFDSKEDKGFGRSGFSNFGDSWGNRDNDDRRKDDFDGRPRGRGRGGGSGGGGGFSGGRSGENFDDGFSASRRDNNDGFGSSQRGFGDRGSSGFSMEITNSNREGGGERRFVSHVPEDRTLDEMYNEDAENAKYEISDLDQEVTVTGVPQSQKIKLDDWKHAGFAEFLLRNVVEKSRYTIPRRIQAAVVPLIQNGWDLFGHAETGSGKTAAFVLPIINYITTNGEPNDSKCAPIALVLAPTRELVGQLYNQTRKFADGTGVTVAKAYGQYRVGNNIIELERGCNILFATMGRLKDFVEHGKVKLHNIKFFVLDEADRMLSQDSFCNDVMNLVHSPDFPSVENRQTLLFSATFTHDVQELAAEILKKDHAFVSNGKATAANPLVEQNFIEVSSANKMDKLIELLEEEKATNGDILRTLVFVQKKQMADVVALNLVQKKIPSSSINGDREQRQREEALRDFRKGSIRVLVATDVCARGIDVKDLEHVINYDMPDDRVTYVHRIGRTGRLHRGKATSFIDPIHENRNLITEIVKVVREVQQVPPEFLVQMVDGLGSLGGGIGSDGFGGGFSRGAGSGGGGFSGRSESGFARTVSSGDKGFGGGGFSSGNTGGGFSSGNTGGGFSSGNTGGDLSSGNIGSGFAGGAGFKSIDAHRT